MTWKAVRQVIDLEGVKPTAKLVLLALAVRANTEGRAWPSLTRICADTGLSERAVQDALKSLVADKLIVFESRPGHTSMLTVKGVADPVEKSDDPGSSCGGDPRSSCANPRSSCGTPPQELRPEVVKEREKKENRAARSSTGQTYGYVNGHVKGGPAAGESWGEYRERGGR